MSNIFKKRVNGEISIVIILAAFSLSLLFISFVWLKFISDLGLPSIFKPQTSPLPSPLPSPSPISVSKIADFKKFSSEEEFKNYLEEGGTGYFVATDGGLMITRELGAPGVGGAEVPMYKALEAPVPERVSETTVQVLGIDEPDIVKTDGKEIYFSSLQGYYWPMRWEIIPPIKTGKIKVIKAFPPADLALEAEIDKAGDLLLVKNVLVSFTGDHIYGYNVSNPKSPEKKWTIDLESNHNIVSARLYKEKIYLITRSQINIDRPCPIRPLAIEGTALEIKCTDIYHPVINVPVDVTYTAYILNPESGKVEKNISFVGSSYSSVLYMSENSIYVTYSHQGDFVKFYYNFLNEKCRDIIPNTVIEKIGKLLGYDISQTAKLIEYSLILENYQNSLNRDERLRIDNELTNRMNDYLKEHKRELEKTGIVKIGLNNFEIASAGSIAGYPLNQFSLDEYENHLRIATTVGGTFGGESANDVYVLDANLKTVGSVLDLGLDERIYSARFIEDKGYLVTFKQIDPFFVLDLSDPKNPQLKGQLKIPGYSSYLHPITQDKILGMGKEGSNVKISLFDVQNPETPAEIDKYTLKEYWSDILNTHHAFLLDKKHQIFFLPGSRGGYVFSYKDNKLSLVKSVSDIIAKRAVYIDDYLYIIGENELVVLNEIDWQRVNELEFD